MVLKDDLFMQRCVSLAMLGRGRVNPNPMVGCVIVKNGKIVGEGYHERFGGPHAEVQALRQAGRRADGATAYVNLEPCAHVGKTPPCTRALIEAGVMRVVASTVDPNPLVGGKGIAELRRAGIRVTTGVLRRESKKLNEKFFFFMEKGLPFVGVKVAQTLDGRIADSKGRSKWITGGAARAYGHALRSEYDAVLVGSGTVLRDNPKLTVRAEKGRNPIRVILDGRFRMGRRRKILETTEAPTVILTTASNFRRNRAKVLALERKGVKVIGVHTASRISALAVLKVLAGLGITSVLIEGGSTTSGPFFESMLVKRVHCFITPGLLGSGITGFDFGQRSLRNALRLTGVSVRALAGDLVLEGALRYP
ncbi:MAG: bifunctional diaminohydroxyphosphoribosylaminopyrimidine deaminase/5-amino-6-(5-phosphoribosylamino)uracil reductase RibD [Bacteroidota bacterium]